jgi:single-stranded DNA-binding protein
MPQNNFIHLSGTLADEPYFELLSGEKGKTPYIRFDLVVERDSGQAGSSVLDPANSQDGFAAPVDGRRADLIRVTEYGVRARIDYFFLKKNAHITVSGWLQSRRYFDRPAKRMRRVIEVAAQKISFGRGCDFERGERQRASIVEQLVANRSMVPPDLLNGPVVLGTEDIALDPA